MNEHLTDEQRLLREALARYLTDHYVFDERRRMAAEQRAFDPAIWQGLAELGVMALPFPTEHGGFDGTAEDVQLIMELLGRHLVREPWVHCVVLAGVAVTEVATMAQQRELIPSLASGETRMALAYAEPDARWNAASVATRAERSASGFRISGRKVMVYGAPVAGRLLVTARTSGDQRARGGISLFMVDADAPGVIRRDYFNVDGSAASDIEFSDVSVAAAALLGSLGTALTGVERAIECAVIALCAEAVGAMRALLEKTVEYARTRVTFGQPLSKQQVIQHKLVDMALAIEHASAITSNAARAIVDDGERRSLLVTAAKALVGRESRFIAQSAVQLHGAIGYTDELDVGHYFRRLLSFDSQFGNRDYHLRRYFQLRSVAGEAGSTLFQLDRLSDDEMAFRKEVRQFLNDNLTPRMIEARERTLWAYSDYKTSLQWHRILHAKGWAASHWPLEFGGTGWTTNQFLVWSLECARARTPLLAAMGHTFCAPCLMAFGTDAQKGEFLPAILSGDDCWAQGYSEPGAGSDLANLQMRATSDDDYYVLNGSKIWTTYAHHANRLFCLVRTSTEQKKQQGITFLLVDLDTPGITIRPILNLAGDHDFNQVFFDDVRVPKSRRLGEEGQGWTVARHLLKFEHGGNVSVIFELENRLLRLEKFARAEPNGCGDTLFNDPDFQLRFAEAAVDAEAVVAAARLTIDSIRDGGAPGSLAELRNIRLREVSQRLTEMLMDALGPYVAADQAQSRELGSMIEVIGPEHCRIPTAFYMTQRAATIAGGTPEIHRNNLARHYLGL